jgi:predicted dehydrogenase
MTQKIGLLGSDNSHAERFSEILNVKDHPSYWSDSGARVWAIWGPDSERTSEAAANGQISVVADGPEQVVAECDMVFVIPRNSDLHLEYAKPAIAAGKPLFVDKPLTRTPDDARELLSLARKAAIPVTSFSTLRYGSDAISFGEGIAAAGPIRYASYMGPAARNSPYGGILFYAIHTVELMQHFHGHDVVSVRAVESPPGADRSNVNVTCTYADGTLVSLGLIGDGVYLFYMMAVGQEGIVEEPGTARNYAADAASRARAESAHTKVVRESEDKPRADHYELGMRQILAVLRGERPGVSDEQMLGSIQLCAAIEESLQRGEAIDPRSL